jgi:hypothetical protein
MQRLMFSGCAPVEAGTQNVEQVVDEFAPSFHVFPPQICSILTPCHRMNPKRFWAVSTTHAKLRFEPSAAGNSSHVGCVTTRPVITKLIVMQQKRCCACTVSLCNLWVSTVNQISAMAVSSRSTTVLPAACFLMPRNQSSTARIVVSVA